MVVLFLFGEMIQFDYCFSGIHSTWSGWVTHLLQVVGLHWVLFGKKNLNFELSFGYVIDTFYM